MDIKSLLEKKANPKIAKFGPGDTVKVSVKVVEGDRERLQGFEGIILKVKHGANGGSFTVRRISHGVGVERTFLFNSPMLDKVELKREGNVRRARLFYLRNFQSKLPRIKEKLKIQTKEEKAELKAQKKARAAGAKKKIEEPVVAETTAVETAVQSEAIVPAEVQPVELVAQPEVKKEERTENKE